MYYILECYGPDEEDRAALGKWPKYEGVNWNLGRVIDRPIPTPIEIELNPEFPGIMMPMFYSGVLLFNDEMISALRKSGVDNFVCYDAIVKDTIEKIEYKNYKVINIIGVIACADLEKSVYDAHGGSALIDTDFESLVIDEKKANGQYMFRLAEAVNAIVIHEHVKKGLEAMNIQYLDFVPPEEWIG